MSDRVHLEDLFRQIVEAAPNAMVLVNGAGRIEMVNAQAEHIFGYERNEILGRPIDLLMPERFRDGHPESPIAFFADPRTLTRRATAGKDVYAVRKDGGEFPVEIGLNPIDTEEGPMVLSTIVDVSHAKEEEERTRAALKEKDILLSEIHHRVKNNLQIVSSLLSLQSARTTDPAALDLLRECQNRVHSMALIHQTLYGSNDFSRVDFARFIGVLLPALIISHQIDPNRIAVRVDVEPVRLPIGIAVPCGLVVNELITNAFKHAFRDRDRGEIRIALTRQLGNEAMLSVSDNGIGLPDRLDIMKTDTLGLQLVEALVSQLDGAVSINRCDPTRFSLRFPI